MSLLDTFKKVVAGKPEKKSLPSSKSKQADLPQPKGLGREESVDEGGVKGKKSVKKKATRKK